MAPTRRHWLAISATMVVALLLAATAWAGTPETAAEPRGIDADTVDGHHAGPSNGVKAERTNRVLWATPQGKIGGVSLPWGVISKRYLGTAGDTFHFVPGAEIQFHFDGEPDGWVLVNNTGQAIVRKSVAGGSVDMVSPVTLPARPSGSYVRIVDFR
ncbi:MAG: hypothetical protein ABIJ48_05515, partial [Actinomycetota bacterium]